MSRSRWWPHAPRFSTIFKLTLLDGTYQMRLDQSAMNWSRASLTSSGWVQAMLLADGRLARAAEAATVVADDAISVGQQLALLALPGVPFNGYPWIRMLRDATGRARDTPGDLPGL
jgi:hypothetical protein